MLRLGKIIFRTGMVVLIGLVCVVLYLNLLEKHRWNKAAANPFIQSIGRWGGDSFKTEVQIDAELLPMGTSRQNWVSIMTAHDFGVDENEKYCSWSGVNGLRNLEKYDSCAVKIVGDTGCCSCSFVYIVAANFEGDSLKEVIGTHGHFMCM